MSIVSEPLVFILGKDDKLLMIQQLYAYGILVDEDDKVFLNGEQISENRMWETLVEKEIVKVVSDCDGMFCSCCKRMNGILAFLPWDILRRVRPMIKDRGRFSKKVEVLCLQCEFIKTMFTWKGPTWRYCVDADIPYNVVTELEDNNMIKIWNIDDWDSSEWLNQDVYKVLSFDKMFHKNCVLVELVGQQVVDDGKIVLFEIEKGEFNNDTQILDFMHLIGGIVHIENDDEWLYDNGSGSCESNDEAYRYDKYLGRLKRLEIERLEEDELERKMDLMDAGWE